MYQLLILIKYIQKVACFNTRSPVLHLFLPIQCQIHNTVVLGYATSKLTFTFVLLRTVVSNISHVLKSAASNS